MSTSGPARTGLAALDYSVLQQCMHCGMCLPACPTYDETKLERHSPRGRIALMRAIADEELKLTKAFGEEMYYCLGCLACTSACPAGVDYPKLFETARAAVEEAEVLRSPERDATRWFALRFLFTRPRLLRLASHLIRLWQASGLEAVCRKEGLTGLLPESLRRLEPQAPRVREKFSHELIAPVEPAIGNDTSTRKVAVLTGCVQDVLFSEINRATVDVLRVNGCEVHTPPVQPCCGSLHAHNGDLETARTLARRLIDLLPPDRFDAIISNAGGCGSHLKAYGHLLHDDPTYAERARAWDAKLKDIHEYLVAIGFRPPRPPLDSTAAATAVTYHESCHLCHGQKISAQPRAILRSLPGFKVVECAESTWCCGSAGIYTITQPETAAQLQERKVSHLRATGAEVVATANPGCHLQIEAGLREGERQPPSVTHPVVLLAEAYRRERPA